MVHEAPPEKDLAAVDKQPVRRSRDTVERTCTEVRLDSSRSEAAGPRSLRDFRDVPAFVLLGDPGAGKTTAFETERQELGPEAVKESARSFVTFNPPPLEWQDKTLFIDGLDEMRAGETRAQSPLDEIRNRLRQLGEPRFRLSCREADWLGNNDLHALAEVSPDSRITVLRLDPLSDSAACRLLAIKYPDLDTESFMADAWQRGIHAMLGNPLTLSLLAEAARPTGHLPDSRLETFEIACRRMASEHNEEHTVAGSTYPIESLIDAAGYWCALLLLVGVEVCSPRSANDPDACVSLEELREIDGSPIHDTLRAALGTKLFKAPQGPGRAPLHRQVAEFLAGRYLAKQISDGLPAGRVVALMAGPSDGRVVTALRGLSAWLAAQSPEARGLMVDTDPVGVALYGDIKRFTPIDKEHLLRALSQLTPYDPILGYEHSDDPFDAFRTDTGWAFRHLASADMVEPIRMMLQDGQSDGADERLEILLLGAVSEAEQSELEPLGELLPDVQALIRDNSRPTAVRRPALEAYRHILLEEVRTSNLEQLLDEFHENADSDLDGELRGTLLSDLYPTVIGPTQIWRYAVAPYQRGIWNRFRGFWDFELAERSSKEQFVELLDALSEAASHLIPALRASGFADLPLKLLARGLTEFGETVEPAHVDRWLRIAGVYGRHLDANRAPLYQIRGWLATHPRAQQAAFLVRLRNRPPEDSPRSWAWRIFDPFLRGTFAVDFGRWCLEKAIEIADAEPTTSRALLTHAFVSLDDRSINDGLTLDIMRGRTGGCPDLARELEELHQEDSEREVPPPDPHVEEIEALQKKRAEQERQRQQEWAQHLRAHETDLRANRYSPSHLEHLAAAYFGQFPDSDPQSPPRRRVADFVGDDADAVDAALAGLRDAVWRADVPHVEETIKSYEESRPIELAYSVLASLDLLEEEDPASLDGLDAAAKRKALAIHYCLPVGDAHPGGGRIVWTDSWVWGNPRGEDRRRNWHDRWVDDNPELVLDMLYQCAVAGIQSGKESPPGLNDLAAITNHDDVVQKIWLNLLGAFPTRAASARLPLLDRLLTKALQYEDRAALAQLVEHRLTLTSTVDGQRIRWLAVNSAISLTRGLPSLHDFVDGNETRTRHLAEVLQHPVEHVRRASAHAGSIQSALASSRDPMDLKSLIEMLGKFFEPMDRGGYVTLEIAMSGLLHGLIERLGSLAGDDATQALDSLIGDSQLAGWHGHLQMARQRQLVAHRDASYRHFTVEEIQCTLDGGAPANAADLAALLREHLTGIRADIRGGNGELWRHFWNEKAHGQPDTRKPENSCRDALLTILRPRLPSGVRAETEHRHAGETRADIEVTSGAFNVPIEVKPNDSPHLWSALHSQLIGKYTSLPETSGCGIYLVLWFGADKTKRDHNGSRPATPEELEQQLANTLTPDEARKVSVLVVDVTKPGVTV